MGAQGALANVNTSALTPTYPAGAVATVTVGWIEAIEKRTTRRSYTTALRQFLNWLGKQVVGEPWDLETVPVNVADGPAAMSLSASTVKHYMGGLRQRLTVGTCNQRLAVIRAWTHTLEDAGLVHPTRAEAIYHLRGAPVSKKLRSFLSDDEVQHLLDSIGTERLIERRDRCLIALLAWNGLRRAEICSLRLRQYTTMAGYRVINELERKGRREDWTKVAVPLQRALEAWWAEAGLTEPEDPMFCAVDQNGIPSGQPLTPHAIYLIVKRRTKAAGLQGDITPHSFRRSAATNADRAGAPTSTIMHGGGWSGRRMPDLYVQVRGNLDRHMVDYLHYAL